VRGWRWAAVLVVLLATAGTATAFAMRPSGGAAAHGSGVPTATAKIVRTDLSDAQQVTGTLSFGGARLLVNQRDGTTFTALPAPGAVIERGQPVYEVDGVAVSLFIGPRPSWRSLDVGVADGSDVLQLNQNLAALGYLSATIAHSSHYGAATSAAVRRWQVANGRTSTGTFGVGDVVWATSPVRVATVDAKLGDPARSGATVAHVTDTIRVVTLQVQVAEQSRLAVGNQVQVELPDGTRVPGKVASISSSLDDAASSDSSQGQAQSRQPALGNVVVTLDDPAQAAAYDAAPVTVDVVEASAHAVLAVPVNALVAPADGGFAVEVVEGSVHRLARVQAGVFSETLVEISGQGIAEGETVVVPAP
jgi:peptidoglycan hydrolase-like protein with peptidoglycan-binding domain